MKITYITNLFPKLSETFILNQITGLIDHGHDIQIIALKKLNAKPFHTSLYDYNLLYKTTYLQTRHLNRDFKYNRQLNKVIKNTDVFHAHFATWPTELALTLFKLTGKPYVFTVHAYDIFKNPNSIILTEMVKNSVNMVTVSNYNKTYIEQLIGKVYQHKIKVIHCGIKVNDFIPVPKKEKKIVKLLTVARLVEKKGIIDSIKAFAELCKNRNDIEYSIIGDGPLKNQFTHIIQELHLQDRIKLLGSRTKQEVIDAMNSSDIYILTSKTLKNGDKEGIPVSILEAQAMQLPVISTYHSGIPEAIINGETGLLVDEGRIDEIKEKINLLVINKKLRMNMGKYGRSNIVKNFNHISEINKLVEIFTKCRQINGYFNSYEQLKHNKYYTLFTRKAKKYQSIIEKGFHYLKKNGPMKTIVKIFTILKRD